MEVGEWGGGGGGGTLSPLFAALRTPVLSSPIYGIFSLRSGEDSYMLFTPALIG